MSTEAHVYMRRHQGAKVKDFDFSNVIYHKFSHGAVAYTLNRENVNVIEYLLTAIDFELPTIKLRYLFHTGSYYNITLTVIGRSYFFLRMKGQI